MRDKFLACDRCGIVFAEKKLLGDWVHYVDLHSGSVVPLFGAEPEKICDVCMN